LNDSVKKDLEVIL
jgi:hypothetical protein